MAGTSGSAGGGDPDFAASPPGADLARTLEDADLGDLSDAVLVDMVVATDRLASWAQARQARAIAELRSRAAMAPPPRAEADPRRHRPLEPDDITALEVGAALRLSPGAATARVGTAAALTERLPRTLGALESGELDWTRTRVIADGTTTLAESARTAALEAGASAEEAQAAVVEVSAEVENRVLPDVADQTTAQVRRSVAHAVMAADPDGAARRHDVAVDGRRARLTPLPDGMAELGCLLSAAEGVAVWNTLNGVARAAKAAGDPRTLAQLRVDTLVAAVVDDAAPRVPAEPDPVPAGPGGDSAFSRRADAARDPRTSRGRRPTVQVTIAADTLLGADDEPAVLDGYGPIPAHLARAIAADGTWRRLVTDPLSGHLLDYGRTTYAPPAALADHVMARDRTCDFPGCDEPAINCDLDHVIPYPQGTTSAANLRPRCRRHHRARHEAGWSVAIGPDGALIWTSPTGHAYTRRPPPIARPRRVGGDRPPPGDDPGDETPF